MLKEIWPLLHSSASGSINQLRYHTNWVTLILVLWFLLDLYSLDLDFSAYRNHTKNLSGNLFHFYKLHDQSLVDLPNPAMSTAWLIERLVYFKTDGTMSPAELFFQFSHFLSWQKTRSKDIPHQHIVRQPEIHLTEVHVVENCSSSFLFSRLLLSLPQHWTFLLELFTFIVQSATKPKTFITMNMPII